MDMLKRSLAPVSEKAWEEIDDQARKVLKEKLSARRFVDVSGPHGWDHGAVVTGRLDVFKSCGEGDVCWGVHVVQPLVEARVSFELDVWELDNVIRGAKDLYLDPVIEAADKMALFEENAVYQGFEPGNITGLAKAGKDNAVTLSAESGVDIMTSISKALVKLKDASIEGPYMLLAGPELWQALDVKGEGYPLRKRLSSLLESGVVFAPGIKDAFVVSARGGDFELTLGQDFCIGYEATVGDKVRLFMAESFTFRVIEPAAVVPLVTG